MTGISGKLILIRHAKAEPLEKSSEDSQRRLTKTGIEDLKKILPELKEYFIAAEEILLCSSQKLRSLQTAEVIADYFGINEIEKHDWISNGNIDGLLAKLKQMKPVSSLVIIGHEPHLSDWSRQLCGSSAIPFSKAMAVGFQISSGEQIKAKPIWMIHPQTIRLQELNTKRKQPALGEFQKILRFQLQEILRMHYKFTISPEDPEPVHQLRVRIRSFRSVLSFLKPLLDQEPYQMIQDQLRSLSQLAGDLRELDVLSQEWTNLLEMYPGLLPHESVLTAILKSEREKEQSESCLAISTEIIPIVFGIWNLIDRELSKQDLVTEATEQRKSLKAISFEGFSNLRIDSWMKKAGKRLKKENFSSDFQAIHALRIRLKKLRYVLEILNPQLHLESKATLTSLKTIQNTLGEYCNTIKNLSILKELNHRYENHDLSYESGLLSGYQIRLAEQKMAEIKEIII